jgi:hypothetical protein
VPIETVGDCCFPIESPAAFSITILGLPLDIQDEAGASSWSAFQWLSSSVCTQLRVFGHRTQLA